MGQAPCVGPWGSCRRLEGNRLSCCCSGELGLLPGEGPGGRDGFVLSAGFESGKWQDLMSSSKAMGEVDGAGGGGQGAGRADTGVRNLGGSLEAEAAGLGDVGREGMKASRAGLPVFDLLHGVLGCVSGYIVVGAGGGRERE